MVSKKADYSDGSDFCITRNRSDYFAPFIQSLIEQYGWRTTFQLLGCLLLCIMMAIQFLPWLKITRGAPDIAASSALRASHGVRWTLRQAAGTLVFWALFWVMFLLLFRPML